MLSGQWWENSPWGVNETAAGQYGFCGNGLREFADFESTDLANIERVEVLSGPASVLYGQAGPGGIVNLVTKQPLRDPFYAVDATIGSFDFYRGAIDLSGPLNDSKTVLYRLNVSYLNRNAFVENFEETEFFISPVISLALGERTRLTPEGEYTDKSNGFVIGLPAEGTVLPNPNGRIPRDRNLSESVLDRTRSTVRYRLDHQFSKNWSLSNAFQISFIDVKGRGILAFGLAPDNRTLNRGPQAYDFDDTQEYNLTLDLIGKFSTGSIDHQLSFGGELRGYSNYQAGKSYNTPPLPTIDLFNPVFGQPLGPLTLDGDSRNSTDELGFYIQDQVTLTENLKLLLGGRFSSVSTTSEDLLVEDSKSSGSNQAFSPRLGIVYQPFKPISLYASYSRSFEPTFGRAFDGSLFKPTRGTQYEVGVKADVNDRLAATLAFYQLTQSNILTTDPAHPEDFSIQVGEQQSRGFELTIQGEILPGWNIIAGYAYTDAKVTKDNSIPVGTRFPTVPENSFNLWTKYEVQRGTFQGFGVGLGLYFVGKRTGDFENTFELPSYLRTDAALYYQRNQFRAALNFRNLFDVTYFEGAYGRGRVFYGEPFAVQGTVSWQF